MLHLVRWLLEWWQTCCCTQEEPYLSSRQHLQGLSTCAGGLGLLHLFGWSQAS